MTCTQLAGPRRRWRRERTSATRNTQRTTTSVNGAVGRYLAERGLLSAQGVQLLIRAMYYDAEYTESEFIMTPASRRLARRYAGTAHLGTSTGETFFRGYGRWRPEDVALSCAEAAHVIATIRPTSSDGLAANLRLTYVISPPDLNAAQSHLWREFILLGCSPTVAEDHARTGAIPLQHRDAVRVCAAVRDAAAARAVPPWLIAPAGSTNRAWDQLARTVFTSDEIPIRARLLSTYIGHVTLPGYRPDPIGKALECGVEFQFGPAVAAISRAQLLLLAIAAGLATDETSEILATVRSGG